MTQVLQSLDITLGQAGLVAALGLALGAGKMGIKGGSLVVIPFLAEAFGGRFAVGLMAPLLLISDIPAVIAYRRDCNWRVAIPIIAWTAVGIGIGTVIGASIPDQVFLVLIGAILLALLALMVFLEIRRRPLILPDKPWVSGPVGAISGFSSMVGNAAGPLLSIYLLAKRLDKAQFLGTGAIVFVGINLVKLPLHIFIWHSVTGRSLAMGALALPFILLGAVIGKPLVRLIPEQAFRYFIMAIALVGAVRLLV